MEGRGEKGKTNSNRGKETVRKGAEFSLLRDRVAEPNRSHPLHSVVGLIPGGEGKNPLINYFPKLPDTSHCELCIRVSIEFHEKSHCTQIVNLIILLTPLPSQSILQ